MGRPRLPSTSWVGSSHAQQGMPCSVWEPTGRLGLRRPSLSYFSSCEHSGAEGRLASAPIPPFLPSVPRVSGRLWTQKAPVTAPLVTTALRGQGAALCHIEPC